MIEALHNQRLERRQTARGHLHLATVDGMRYIGNLMTQPTLGDETEVSRSLIERIRAGDPAAEAEMVERYSRGVFFLLRKLCRDEERALDLNQETFRVAIEKLREGSVRDSSKLGPYLRGTAYNLERAEFRKKKRRKTEPNSEVVDDVREPLASQLQLAIQAEQAEAVRQVLAELPVERDRQVLRLFFLEDQAKAEICAELELEGRHFDRVMYRAKKRFLALYTKRGGERPAVDWVSGGARYGP